MPRIDKFIETLYSYRAERLLLASGEPAFLVSSDGRRPVSGGPASAQQVEGFLREILPADVPFASQNLAYREFTYISPWGALTVQVQRTHDQIVLQLQPQAEPAVSPPTGYEPATVSADPEPATPPAPAASVTPRIEALFEEMIRWQCSDLHLCAGHPPMYRRDGEIVSFGDSPPLTAEQVRDLILPIVPGPHRAEFEANHDADFSYEIEGLARMRCNLFMDRLGLGGVFRFIPNRIPTAQDLGLSSAILELCQLTKGLVLVTGPTGSGKSTTLAAMIETINEARAAHIITIEDPIEFVYPQRRCLINQREVGRHTVGFKQALRAALREDPDIVLVGEMRDLDEISIALETAETGHLVFGTLHTNTAASTVDRIIDQFPADHQNQVRSMLADSLRGVIAQVLCKRKRGGLVAAHEVLLVNPAVSNLIREGKTFQIPTIIQTGRAAGMVTLNDALLDLVRKGIIDPQEALAKSIGRAEFKTYLERVDSRPVPQTNP